MPEGANNSQLNTIQPTLHSSKEAATNEMGTIEQC